MNKLELLFALKAETEKAVCERRLPVSRQKSDAEQPPPRAPHVYLMLVPDSKSAEKKAPYILHQLLTGKDQQNPGEHVESIAVVRTTFCVYDQDDQEGGIALLNVMERLRIHLLERVVIDRQYELDLESGIEYLAYPDNIAPYFAGEMMTTWKIPAVERSVEKLWL